MHKYLAQLYLITKDTKTGAEKLNRQALYTIMADTTASAKRQAVKFCKEGTDLTFQVLSADLSRPWKKRKENESLNIETKEFPINRYQRGGLQKAGYLLRLSWAKEN